MRRQHRPAEEPAQREHDVRRILRIEVADAEQRRLQVIEQRRDLAGRRRVDRRRRGHRVARRPAQLPADQQHRLGQVERGVLVARVDGAEALAVAQVGVRQPVVFGTEDDRHRPRRGPLDDRRRQRREILDLGAIAARAAGRADHEVAVGDGRRQGLDHAGVAQEIARVHRHAIGGGESRHRRSHEGEVAHPEVLHRPRRRPDVGGTARPDQHDAHVAQRCDLRRRRFGHLALAHGLSLPGGR